VGKIASGAASVKSLTSRAGRTAFALDEVVTSRAEDGEVSWLVCPASGEGSEVVDLKSTPSAAAFAAGDVAARVH
jgi:hypothetical protein